tara:strand:- start:733 stop:1518 length:786 start_codon:yes stop_codon:yes gene_type:complete
MKIISYNVAGLRAMLKKQEFYNFLEQDNYTIICLQETKAEEKQIVLSDISIINKYKYKYYNSTKGTTQRRGLSGTAIWSQIEPNSIIKNPDFDEEGRVIGLEFSNFVLINVYVPNSQRLESERYYFRENWNLLLIDYLNNIKTQFNKPVILCGDMNVAHNPIDICNPKSKQNRVPGYFNNERIAFSNLLESVSLIDCYRHLNKETQISTYWSNFLKAPRQNNNGWRIDYFLVSNELIDSIKNIDTLMNIFGSDHCPQLLEF